MVNSAAVIVELFDYQRSKVELGLGQIFSTTLAFARYDRAQPGVSR
jgi:hypothetical protein